MPENNLPILIIDDHCELTKALTSFVQSLGYAAVAVTSGEQALEFLRTRSVRLILLDLQMPDLSGWDVLRAIRTEKRFGAIPIVICSATNADENLNDVLRLGAQAYIIKSNVFEELEGVLTQHLN